jgi:hypothetical protein
MAREEKSRRTSLKPAPDRRLLPNSFTVVDVP